MTTMTSKNIHVEKCNQRFHEGLMARVMVFMKHAKFYFNFNKKTSFRFSLDTTKMTSLHRQLLYLISFTEKEGDKIMK